MSSNPRTELLVALDELGARYPAWRFGQLVANVTGWVDADLWDVEDRELVVAIRAHLARATADSASTAR